MNIYFSGIGGVGIGPLAEIAFDAGYSVQGSDLVGALVTKELEARGITVHIGQDGSFLQACHDSSPIDWFVYTAALPSNHAELLLAKQLGIRTSKRDEFLAQIVSEKNLQLIAVSGTHGKTTTAGMLVWTLQRLGVSVSYSIGTTLQFGPSGMYDAGSKYFVYECDEFDRNFLQFSPHLSLISSIDYDHPDTYPTESEYTDAFKQFIRQSAQVIMWQSDAEYIADQSDNAWILQPDEVLDITIPGEHNRRNATLVAKAIEYLQLGEHDDTIGALSRFPGADRRFERLAENLYSDYGHHPAEIAATLQLAREISDHVVLVYQPHQNRRQHRIKDDYYDKFELAETVYWLPTYLSREDDTQTILEPEELIAGIKNKEAIHIAQANDELWENIEKARSEGKLVLGMGAGTIDTWLREKIPK